MSKARPECRCGKPKHIRPSGKPSPLCLNCLREYNRNWRALNPERSKDAITEWKRKNRPHLAAYARKRRAARPPQETDLNYDGGDRVMGNCPDAERPNG